MTDQDCPECGNQRIAIRTDVYKDGREFVYCDACGCCADRRVWNRIAPAIHRHHAEYESWRCISGGAADSWAATKPAATDESLCLECQGSSCTAGEKCEAMSNPVRISYERAGRCFWHLQCKAQHHAPPMAIDRDDKDGKRTLLRCTACERAGWYPYGSVGEVSCEEQK